MKTKLLPRKIWELINTSKSSKILETLLENRGLKTQKEKEEFINPTDPGDLGPKELGIDKKEIDKLLERIKKAKENKEKVVVYGDYDADGICATAVLWETLYGYGLNVSPFIPDRFNEGYGLSEIAIERLKKENPDLSLIITVDNGIVANKAVDVANKLGIDVVITDHHEPSKKLPKAYAIIHTTKIGGAEVAWIVAREVRNEFKINLPNGNGLELAGIGTIADQLPLVGPNRSFAKYGLNYLNKTTRCGLLALFENSQVKKGEIGTYEINYVIAPRINAMGRLAHAIESLRLLCTKDDVKARDLSINITKVNVDRQKLVEDAVGHARLNFNDDSNKKIILIYHESYHEGVIGLAASRLVEEFYRPAIVISTKGEIGKASARSISGFNLIENLRKLEDLWLEGGGHPMAAGFSIEVAKIEEFKDRLEKLVEPLLTPDLLTRKLKIDLETQFDRLDWDLAENLKKFEPTGNSNPTPLFLTKAVKIMEIKTVGAEKKHLKLKLSQNGKVFDAIAFGFGEFYDQLSGNTEIDVVYSLEENIWNGSRSLQLRVKDFCCV